MKPMLPMDEIATCPFGTRIDGFERCGAPGVKRLAAVYYCLKHFRFMDMRMSARREGKAVPEYRQLELLVPHDMRCPHCRATMVWHVGARDPRANVVSLQHYLDGTFGLICQRCNVIHGKVSTTLGDADAVPDGMSHCPRCRSILPLAAFYRQAARRDGVSCWCRACCKATGNARNAARRRIAAGGSA